LPRCRLQLSIGSLWLRKYNRRVYFVYSVLLALALVLGAPWWLLEMARYGKYRTGLGERLGFVPERLFDRVARDTIWIHAVSVGEVLAVSRMVEELKARLPGWRIVISTTTDSGQKLARQRFGDSDAFYFPLDFAFAVRAYLQALRPKLLVLAESEFWPNLLHETRKSGAAVAVVNARVSDRSLPRYVRFRGWLRPVMQDVVIFLAQTEEDARRLVEIGAPAQRVHVGGNLKFEVKPPVKTPFVGAFAAALRRDEIGPVVVAGSTLNGEEALMLVCFESIAKQYRNALLVLAPRHPERFDYVAKMLTWWEKQECPNMPWRRRSEWSDGQLPAGGVFLLDSIGELASLYEFADLAFVGGSLVPKGGHNVLEAAQFGAAILVGPYTENFRDIIAVFQKADALRVVTPVTPQSLNATVMELLGDDAQREQLGQRAREVIRSQQGATERTVAALLQLLPSQSSAAAVTAGAERHA
jgi:3-deoxy-D-manno-octulosonic-acid transferase